MKNQLLVTAVGEDRPGIVARLTEAFVKHGANVQESRMSILGGEFAAIVLVSVADEKIGALKGELNKISDITITTKETKPLSPDRFEGHVSYHLTLNGADHEGIVHKVSAFLHDRSINIQSMDTDVLPAPETGTPLFRLQAILLVPPQVKLHELKGHLNEIGSKECVDIEVSELSKQDKRLAAPFRS